jgi:aminoglycoside phosphotransferase
VVARLFTYIAGSTKLWEEHTETMRSALNDKEDMEKALEAPPPAYDHVNQWQPSREGKSSLSAFQEALILSAFLRGAQVARIGFVGDRTGPPIKVMVVTQEGTEIPVLLRTSRLLNGVETETQILPLLARLGLPVPQVLAGPAYEPDAPEIGAVCVLSFLPGDNLQNLSLSASTGVEVASRLVLEAVDRLHGVTEQLRNEAAADHLTRRDLLTELRLIVERGGPWIQQPLFWQAVRQLVPVLARIDTPLVFSNGDYNPANFLSDGQQITGFIDFEMACFEDPHYGFAKYRVYDMYPFYKTGLVERYLQGSGLSEVEFAPRMAVRCLWTLQREIPVFPDDTRPRDWAAVFEGEAADTASNDPQAGLDGYRRHVLKLLRQSLEMLA